MAYAAGIAEQTGASIMMLHVIQDGSGAVDLKTFSQQAAAIQQRLTELIPSRGKRSYALETRVDSGEPFRVILKTIEDSKPSLVILNTHGHGFLDRLLIGSTADRVVRGGAAMCPMLLFPSSRSS
jgi:nucleotide-binding universal stress UspA family protein